MDIEHEVGLLDDGTQLTGTANVGSIAVAVQIVLGPYPVEVLFHLARVIGIIGVEIMIGGVV